jgi:YVTN family beta-propeller protein
MRRSILRVGLASTVIAVALGVLVATTSNVAAVSAQQTLKTSGDPFAVAIDAAGGRAYVTDTKLNTLYVFDLATAAPITWIPTGRQPNHVVLSGTRAYVSNFGDASITVIDTAAKSVLKTLSIGGLGLALDATAHRLYAAGGSRIFALDVLTDTVAATITAPAGANLWGVAVDPATSRVYATDIANPRVLIYDGATATKVGEIAIDAPARFAITTGAAGRVFVASYTDKNPQLSIIDGPGAKVVARVGVAAFSTSLALQSSTGLVYASSAVDRSVTAVDPGARSVRSKNTVADTPGGVAVHPVSGNVFVATSGGTPPPLVPSPVRPVPAAKP